MRNCLIILLLVVGLSSSYAQYSQLSLEGKYQGKNIYITNPTKESGIGFCVDSIWVNGAIYSFSKSSAFEINLQDMNFEMDDSVWVKIQHYWNCQPKVLTTGADFKIFEISNAHVSVDSVLKWSCPRQDRLVCFRIEHFRWNKWVSIGDTCSNGNRHSFDLATCDIHAGENKFRVVSGTIFKRGDVSAAALFQNKEEPIVYKWQRDIGKLDFSRATKWEIYDVYGDLKQIGRSTSVDCSDYETGMYYLNFDNQTSYFNVIGL
ncbi:MAG: hypothetical protein JKY54_16915 [Flavobacteriales bacterium]|nr:hypothetical protein [Flavobacteriales bacterium]